jgi:hypothetical protein
MDLLDQVVHPSAPSFCKDPIGQRSNVLVSHDGDVGASQRRHRQILGGLPGLGVEQHSNGIVGNVRVRQLVPVKAGGTLVAAEQVPPAGHVAAVRDLDGLIERGQQRRAGYGAETGGGSSVE